MVPKEASGERLRTQGLQRPYNQKKKGYNSWEYVVYSPGYVSIDHADRSPC